MIISNLTYLETVSEASSVVGGRNKNVQKNKIKQSITQKSKAASLAVGEGATSGDAVAVNFGLNVALIEDNNQGLLDQSF